MKLKPASAIYLNPLEQSRTPEHWAADVLDNLLGGHDVTILPVRDRDPFLQIPYPASPRPRPVPADPRPVSLQGAMRRRRRWYFSFNTSVLLEIMTPWFYLIASYGGYCLYTDSFWHGIEIGWKADWHAPIGQLAFARKKRWEFQKVV